MGGENIDSVITVLQQLALLSGLLAGFSLSGAFQFAASGKGRPIVEAGVIVFSIASIFSILSTFLSSSATIALLRSQMIPGYTFPFYRTSLTLSFWTIVISLSMFLVGISLIALNRSKALGIPISIVSSIAFIYIFFILIAVARG